jgi:Saxitoxin biosynthesis operon protein SxtJ
MHADNMDRLSSKLPSERSFGLLFMAVAACVGAYGVYKSWSLAATFISFAVSLALGLATVIAPRLLAPLNRAWFHFGLLLGKIFSPIVLGVIYFGILTPVAFITRRFGRDELRLKLRPVSSYWTERNPPGTASDSFKNQF